MIKLKASECLQKLPKSSSETVEPDVKFNQDNKLTIKTPTHYQVASIFTTCPKISVIDFYETYIVSDTDKYIKSSTKIANKICSFICQLQAKRNQHSHLSQPT